MLSQYRNIEHLLGPTDDWTAPGTHCEILLRDLLRQFLPSNFRSDKGFVYGRRVYKKHTKHCPEIDILIHDNQHFRPIFQIEDFVIVQAKALHGAIQVKRKMDTKQLKDGFKNVMDAKDHFRWLCQGSLRNPTTRFFSAVVFFDEVAPRKDGRASKTYRNTINKLYKNPDSWFLAPDVFGSLQHHFFRRDDSTSTLKYTGFPANYNGQNIAVLILLTMLLKTLGVVGCELPDPRLSLPNSLVEVIEVNVPAKKSSKAKSIIENTPSKDGKGT